MSLGISFPPEQPAWIVCGCCNFGMRCDSQADAHEIASKHLKNFSHGSVDVVATLADFNRLMAEKPLPPSQPENHGYHRKVKHTKEVDKFDHQLL